MGRQTEYRAWNKRDKCMIDWNEIIRSAFNFQSPNLLFDVFAEELHYLEPLQYTGIKDRAGTKIFEGDLVKCLSYAASMVNAWSNKDEAQDKEIYKIEWVDCRPMLVGADGKWAAVLNHHVMSKPEQLEVIGNIYENPELLKECE